MLNILRKCKLTSFRRFRENLPPVSNEQYKDKPSIMTHCVYDLKAIEDVPIIHYPPKTFGDK